VESDKYAISVRLRAYVCECVCVRVCVCVLECVCVCELAYVDCFPLVERGTTPEEKSNVGLLNPEPLNIGALTF
jgi:hypothetical protein